MNVTVDAQRFREAVWAVERENFRPGDALDALERAKVDVDPASQLRGAVSRSETAEKIIRDLLEQLDPSRPYDQGEAVTAALHWLRAGDL